VPDIYVSIIAQAVDDDFFAVLLQAALVSPSTIDVILATLATKLREIETKRATRSKYVSLAHSLLGYATRQPCTDFTTTLAGTTPLPTSTPTCHSTIHHHHHQVVAQTHQSLHPHRLPKVPPVTSL
jgi:hypothetical protein